MENRFNQEFKWTCPVMDDDVEDLYKLNYGDNAGRAYCRAITSGAYEMAVISRLIAYLDFKLMMREMRREQDEDFDPWECFAPDSGESLFTPEEDAEDLMNMSFMDRVIKKMDFPDDEEEDLFFF